MGLLLVGYVAKAQQQIVWGYLRDSISNEPIELGSVTNTTHKSTAITNNQGQFKISIAKNDVLTVSAVGYRYFKVFLTKYR